MRFWFIVLVPPESPGTERCPAGPSTERRSCRSACVQSGDAYKGQAAGVNPTVPSVSSPPGSWASGSRYSLQEAGEVLGRGLAARPATEAAHKQGAASLWSPAGNTSVSLV